MITRVHIENFKSVANLDLDLGRFNVFIGENGCGKSNILEAIVVGAAAAHDKLGNEFLAPRGVRLTDPGFMRTALAEVRRNDEIRVRFDGEDGPIYHSTLQSIGYGQWLNGNPLGFTDAELTAHLAGAAFRIKRADEGLRSVSRSEFAVVLSLLASAVGEETLPESVRVALKRRQLLPPEVLIYAPENTALRTFQSEGHVLPLGIKGEGLFAHLQKLAAGASFAEIVQKLALIEWFENFDIPDDLMAGERRLRIRDRYLAEGALFDQRSANEGFLFLLFYFTLFVSPETPAFIIIDNVDTSLNPKLCRKLITELVALARAHGKQAILTTHNPAVLDGLNLHDDEQRLFVVSRNDDGATVARRVDAPKQLEGAPPVRLSEAFLRGYIGGLPDNF